MQINVTFDQITANLPAGFVSAVNYVVNYFDNLFTNNATININVGYGEVGGSALGSNALGSSITNYFGANYNSIKSALVAENAPGASTLPSSSPLAGSPILTQAEAKALALTSTTSTDGYVGFSNAVSWDYTTATPSAGQYYLIGTIEHEITEVMGRQSMINYAPNFYSAMDLYRYSAPGVRSVAAGGAGSTAYFSVDNGVTNLGTWNNNASNGDLGDWYPSGPAPGGKDALNDYSSSGVINIFSASDITNMEAIGWTVANGAAAPTIASFSPDSGTVGDGITNATVLILAGTATASSTVNVYDGATLLGTAVADANGAWSFTTGTLSNGSHSFTATDTVSGTTSAAVTATVDTTAPGETISSTIGTNTGSTSTITSGGLTHDNTLALSGTVSDANGVSSVQIYDGATLLGTATVNNGTWSFTTAGLLDGNHSFTAKATDAAGNTTTTAAVTATVDTTASTGGMPDLVAASDSGSSNTDNITSITSPTFTVALNSTVAAGDVVELLQSGASFTHAVTHIITSADITAGSVSLAVTAGDFGADGSKSISAKFTDASSNTSTTAALAVTLDTTAPGETISSTIGTNTGSTSTITSGGLTHDNTLALSGTVSDANGVPSVQIYDGATLLGPAAVNNGTWSFTTTGLLDGNHSFTAKAIDVAGNTTTTAAVTAIVDTTAPAAPIISSFSPDTGVVGDHITNVNTLTLTGMAEANSTIKVYDGSTLVGSAMASGSGAWNFTTGTLANGPHSFTATDTDAAGNTSLVSQPINPIVDTTAPAAPVFSCISPVGDGITSVNTLTLTGDAEANSTVKLYDGTTLLGNVTANGSGQWTYTTAALADGAHSLIATDTDAAGNTGAASFALSVLVDTVAPTLAVSGISQDANNSVTLTGTSEAYSWITVYDGTSGMPLGTATSAADGTWTVQKTGNTATDFTVTATDLAGNTTHISNLEASPVPIAAALADTMDTVVQAAPINASFSPNNGIVGEHITHDTTLGNTEAALDQATPDSSGARSVQMGAPLNTVQGFSTAANSSASHPGTANIGNGTVGNGTNTAGADHQYFFGNGGSDAFVFSDNVSKSTMAGAHLSNDALQQNHNVFEAYAEVAAQTAHIGYDAATVIDPSHSDTLHNATLMQLTSHDFHLV